MHQSHLAQQINKKYRNVTIENSGNWNLEDLMEILQALDTINGPNGFNGNMDAFEDAFGNVVFTPVPNGAIRNDENYVADANQRTGLIRVTPNATDQSIIHEMGHLFSWAEKRQNSHVASYGAMYSNVFDAGGGATKYARDFNSTGEDFADSFLALMRDGPGTKAVSPDRINVMTSLILAT